MATRRVAHLLRRPLNSIAILAVVLVLLGLFVQRQNYLLDGTTALTFALAATGMGVALGLAGEFILGQLALFAVGAYVTALFTVTYHWSFWPAAVAGLVGAVVTGLMLSVVGLRTSSFYFALIGFFIVYLIPDLAQILAAWTGGTAGLAVPDIPDFFGATLDTRGMFLLATAVLIVALVIVAHLRSSPLGINMRRLRDAPVTLTVTGVPAWRVRVAAYVLSSVLAGAGGAIYSHISGYLIPADFNLTTTVMLFAAVIVGGSTTLLGPAIGVLILYLVPLIVINIQSYADLVYGVTVLVAVLVARGAIGQAALAGYRRLRARAAPRLRLSRQTASRPGQPRPARAPDQDLDSDTVVDILWGLRASRATRTVGPLVVRGARKGFGGVTALDMSPEMSIAVQPGEVHLLLGPNGCGKSTLLNAICGLIRLDQGEVLLDGTDITNRPAVRIARAGVSRSFQAPNLPDEVTPRDLMTAALCQLQSVSYLHWLSGDWVARRALRDTRRVAEEVASATGLLEALDAPCAALTSGQRRILDVLLALMSRSAIVLLDEPAAGLSELERTQLGRLIRALAARGLGFIVVEHDLNLAFSIADRVTVLAAGRTVAHGTPEEIRIDPSAHEVLTGARA